MELDSLSPPTAAEFALRSGSYRIRVPPVGVVLHREAICGRTSLDAGSWEDAEEEVKVPQDRGPR